MDLDQKKQRLIALLKNIGHELKGKNMLYTSANGHMYSQLNKAGELGIRLSPDDYSLFETAYGECVYKSYGAVMKGYVLIPEEMWDDEKQLAHYFDLGLSFVNSLPPK